MSGSPIAPELPDLCSDGKARLTRLYRLAADIGITPVVEGQRKLLEWLSREHGVRATTAPPAHLVRDCLAHLSMVEGMTSADEVKS